MGACTSKPKPSPDLDFDTIDEIQANNDVENVENPDNSEKKKNEENNAVGKRSPLFPFYSPSPARYLFSKKSPARSPAPSSGTPRRFLKRPFPPPSPAKHIKALLARRHGAVKPNGAAIPEGKEVAEGNTGLDKSFGFSKNFCSKYELGEEVGRGHFGYTCKAKFKKGELKGQEVAVKVIPKAKMTTAIAIEDVRKEVKILRALTGHNNLIRFYDAYEDHDNVYVVMELCEGGELLDRILSRGGKYTEDDAKTNFLFTSKEEDSSLKVIDFGLSDFVKPDERLNDIVGSAYYVAPEVLHRAYSTEADVWSIGVIAYILLCGSRPFWARTESGIFRAVVKAEPTYEEQPWPNLSSEAKDFVKRHPWIRNTNDVKVPLDILIFKLMKAYMRSSPLRKAALRALSKTLTADELFYLREQFALLEPNNNGTICIDNIKMVGHEETRNGCNERELGLSPSVPVHAVLHDWIRHTDGKLSFLGFVKLLHGVSSRSLAKVQ
ncbi:CDPK-related kinase 5 [Phtheirospermum japonicum]|uniref:non-specific serine/threonine protein kinase n=1 Tax=Phtheirospermum japonicum TaxID=374723 RepID=A0A830CJ78_9LAMI|nr:CDPK-related kinase 5 [Phtheirospermum japonicum]